MPGRGSCEVSCHLCTNKHLSRIVSYHAQVDGVLGALRYPICMNSLLLMLGVSCIEKFL